MSPFSNLNVLDMSANFAGSYCGRLLSGFGASVKKIIIEGREDRSSSYGPFLNEKLDPKSSAMFHYMNHNKQVVSISKDDERIHELLLSADLLIEDFSNEDLRTIGLDMSNIRGLNPYILICSLAPFGKNTKWEERSWSDLTIQALTGMCSVNGEQGKPP